MSSEPSFAGISPAIPQTGNHRGPGLPTWVAGLGITLAGTLAYLNSFQGTFVLDDIQILSNVDIRRLWPLWPVLAGPENASRPLVSLTLAINYAISGYEIWSYHLVNLLIHIAAGLTLFGIVRRTLQG